MFLSIQQQVTKYSPFSSTIYTLYKSANSKNVYLHSTTWYCQHMIFTTKATRSSPMTRDALSLVQTVPVNSPFWFLPVHGYKIGMHQGIHRDSVNSALLTHCMRYQARRQELLYWATVYLSGDWQPQSSPPSSVNHTINISTVLDLQL